TLRCSVGGRRRFVLVGGGIRLGSEWRSANLQTQSNLEPARRRETVRFSTRSGRVSHSLLPWQFVSPVLRSRNGNPSDPGQGGPLIKPQNEDITGKSTASL